MKIGIVGAGTVGGTLGGRWARHGHDVTFSSREPESEKMRKLVSDAGANARRATLSDTVASCDVLLLSTPWPATKEILADAAGLSGNGLSGKILIDAVNPIAPGFGGLDVGGATSAAEMIAGWAPGAKVVKAFNTIGSNIMADANLSGHAALLLYCGDDADAKKIVRGLATELGFDAEDAGPLRQARLLEPMALLWVTLAYAQGFGREFAFKIVRR